MPFMPVSVGGELLWSLCRLWSLYFQSFIIPAELKGDSLLIKEERGRAPPCPCIGPPRGILVGSVSPAVPPGPLPPLCMVLPTQNRNCLLPYHSNVPKKPGLLLPVHYSALSCVFRITSLHPSLSCSIQTQTQSATPETDWQLSVSLKQ